MFMRLELVVNHNKPFIKVGDFKNRQFKLNKYVYYFPCRAENKLDIVLSLYFSSFNLHYVEKFVLNDMVS